MMAHGLCSACRAPLAAPARARASVKPAQGAAGAVYGRAAVSSSFVGGWGAAAAGAVAARRRAPLTTVAASQPDTEEARSPADAPQEWEAPQPSRRPDIFPEFEKVERVILPKPLPGDPEQPDEEADEAAKRTEPGDPDPEAPPGEPSEPEPRPGEGDPTSPERKDPSIPTAPE
ncbi:hypothetical protein Rsub_05819 [Raphidocelis subcapitata]|uniref:Uncharacterized protein n=1 Tax=Raphidocelis subcapitata TaxID=307507 RepID=A0A2V0P548_9CHLO|nr:hypothetical protein Rsub_05819 [Raphidocelis subcapitata]|eukprot:GBF92983.1 hypothetical protein Rsub_05819 [Raphidocelis subcapitata]